jgi:hypothetical protein
MFNSYVTYEKSFPVKVADAGDAEGGALAEPQGTDGSGDAIDIVKKRFKIATTHSVIEFLYDLLSGVHDKGIKDAVRGSSVGQQSLKDVKWMDCSALPALRDVFRSLTAHRAMVQIGSGPPALEGRSLKRWQSDSATGGDPEREAELKKARQETWRQAIVGRKKFCSILSCRGNSAAAYQMLFERSDAYRVHNLKATEAHRVFLFSAELWQECASQPWANPPDWSDATNFAMQFMVGQRGNSDVLIFCDGRSRSCRMELEKQTDGARYTTEFFVIYAPTHRLGRRVAFSSASCEVVLVSLPVNRTMWTTRERSGDFSAAGESSTHDTTYSGVQAVPWAGLPLLSAADKAKVNGVPEGSIEQPRATMFDSAGGIPLFWQERKPVKLWKKMFEDLQARVVIDLTPGGGLAARAAMEMGITYLGLTRTAEHNQWLTNVCDRNALRSAVTSGTALYRICKPASKSILVMY